MAFSSDDSKVFRMSFEEIEEQLLANQRKDAERRNRIRRFFGLKPKPVSTASSHPTASSSDKNGMREQLICKSPLPKASTPKPAPLAHIATTSLSANVLLQPELFTPISSSYSYSSFSSERAYLEDSTRPGSFLNNEKLELGAEALYVYQVVLKNPGSEYNEYKKSGESGNVRKDDARNRIVISLSRYFIYTHLDRILTKVQENSLYWQQYAISAPTPMIKAVAYIDLSSPERKIRDIETNEVIASYTGDPYGAGAVFVDMIASRHGKLSMSWYGIPNSPNDLYYEAKVASKYMDFLCYETRGNWCKKT